MQLAEVQKEVQAEHERSQAAEQALEAQRREKQAAEYARSRPTSPFRDPALQSELASLRQQVCCIQPATPSDVVPWHKHCTDPANDDTPTTCLWPLFSEAF